MTLFHRSDRKRIFHNYSGEDEEENTSRFRSSEDRFISAKNVHDQEKRIRREIANSNERRRMQNINAGLNALKSLLPNRKGEKLSKVAILQNAADYVFELEQDKLRLLQQNSQMSRKISDLPNDSNGCSDSSASKRKRRKTVDSADEGIGSSSSLKDDNSDDSKQEMRDLRLELEHERALRILLEEQIKKLESRIANKECDCAEETVKPSILVMNYGHESGISSPQSQISSQDIESAPEMSQRGSSPELSSSEIPSERNTISCAKQSVIHTANIPGLLMPSPMNSSLYPVPPPKVAYNMSRSRQNLETIVEAIKHVEGLHVFPQ